MRTCVLSLFVFVSLFGTEVATAQSLTPASQERPGDTERLAPLGRVQQRMWVRQELFHLESGRASVDLALEQDKEGRPDRTWLYVAGGAAVVLAGTVVLLSGGSDGGGEEQGLAPPPGRPE